MGPTISMRRVIGALVVVAAAAACQKEEERAKGADGASVGAATPGSKPTLHIWWFVWAPADGLQELGNDFEKETGIAVKVDQIPLASYQDKVFLEFSNATPVHPTAFDIVVGDSQWIGRGATNGLYVDLTD